jgi:hypothetical protein
LAQNNFNFKDEYEFATYEENKTRILFGQTLLFHITRKVDWLHEARAPAVGRRADLFWPVPSPHVGAKMFKISFAQPKTKKFANTSRFVKFQKRKMATSSAPEMEYR